MREKQSKKLYREQIKYQIKLAAVLAFFLLSGIVYGWHFGFSGEAFSMGTATEPEALGISAEEPIAGEDLLGKININTADKMELMRLSGIGEKTAQEMIAYRTENGAFQQIQDIMDVPGIGEKKFEKIKDDITVE